MDAFEWDTALMKTALIIVSAIRDGGRASRPSGGRDARPPGLAMAGVMIAAMKTDDRKDYGEERQIGIGYIGTRLFAVVFVERESAIRVISLRKATKPEATLYASS